MSGKINPSSSSNEQAHPQSNHAVNHSDLDHPALWLNYEDKMDELRNRFLTIASILFAVQVGVFALMVDKIVLIENEIVSDQGGEISTLLPFITGILLIVFSFLTLMFLRKTYKHYASHIITNKDRSCFVVRQCPYIRDFKDHQKAYLKDLPAKPKGLQRVLNRDPLAVLKSVYRIYTVLPVFTVMMFALGWYFNPNLQQSFSELKLAWELLTDFSVSLFQ
jgi:hypothetical protein